MTYEERVDAALDAVLKASGSALKYYSMPSSLAKMRKAMGDIMKAEYIAGSNAAVDAFKQSREER